MDTLFEEAKNFEMNTRKYLLASTIVFIIRVSYHGSYATCKYGIIPLAKGDQHLRLDYGGLGLIW